MPMQIQFRRDTAANWTSSNPTLLAGEFGYETDTQKYKIGNGTTAWNSLGYAPAILTPAAGTTTVAPLTFASGTNLTTPAAGAWEFDGNVPYFSVAASTRGVVNTEQFIVLSSTNTLTSQTGAQALFDGGGGPTNGAVTVPVGTYQFECFYSLSSMSATSGSFGFALGGTATYTQMWWSVAQKGTATLATATATQSTFNTTANTTLATASANTVGYASIRGIVRCTVTGTLIPQVSLGVAAAAVVGVNSYFRLYPVGNGTVVSVGNWS